MIPFWLIVVVILVVVSVGLGLGFWHRSQRERAEKHENPRRGAPYRSTLRPVKPPTPKMDVQTFSTSSLGSTPQQPGSTATTVNPVHAGGITFSLRLHGHGAMDQAWDQLHKQAFTSPGVIQWPEFRAAVAQYVRASPTPGAMNDLFSYATGLWQLLVDGGKFQHADGLWAAIFDAVTEAESAAGQVVHKGAGYYFWGLNALQNGDTDRGLLLMHEALREDIALSGTAGPCAFGNAV